MTHWAEKILAGARERGALNGYPDGTMRPDDLATRAHLAAVANRLYHLTKESFKDVAAAVEWAVVMVVNEGKRVVEDGRRVPTVDATGSGVSAGGGVVTTNAHVVLNPDGSRDPLSGIVWHSWGYGEDGRIRYAMAEMLVLPLGDLDEFRHMQPVVVFGSSVGMIGSGSAGVGGYKGRTVSYRIPPDRMVTSTPVQRRRPDEPRGRAARRPGRRAARSGLRGPRLRHRHGHGPDGAQHGRDLPGGKAPHVAARPREPGWYVTPVTHTHQRPVLQSLLLFVATILLTWPLPDALDWVWTAFVSFCNGVLVALRSIGVLRHKTGRPHPGQTMSSPPAKNDSEAPAEVFAASVRHNVTRISKTLCLTAISSGAYGKSKQDWVLQPIYRLC